MCILWLHVPAHAYTAQINDKIYANIKKINVLPQRIILIEMKLESVAFWSTFKSVVFFYGKKLMSCALILAC